MNIKEFPIIITSIYLSYFLTNVYMIIAEEYNVTIVPNAADMATTSNQTHDPPFDPSDLQIKNGSTVIWINKDSNPHNIVSGDPETGPDGKIDPGIIEPDQNFSHTFKKLETINYFDSFNPQMTGTIEVKENVTLNQQIKNETINDMSDVVVGLKGR
jgi:plastocyanin